jgi:hypothetical protein
MSYAGPASRERSAQNIEPMASTEISGRSGFRTTSFRPRSLPGARRDAYLAFAAGIALGLTIGAGTALLLAPQSGTDTRRAIVRKGRRLGRRGSDAWDDLREELAHAARRGRQAFRRRRQRSKDSAAD